MGGEGSGRLPSINTIINRMSQPQPVGSRNDLLLTLPNYSGVREESLNTGRTYGRFIKPYYWSIGVTSQTVQSSGRVFLEMFEVPTKVVVDSITHVNAATLSGSAIVGIYKSVTNDTCENGSLIVQSAQTDIAGSANNPQTITFNETSLDPGIYYAAISFSNTTSTYMRNPNGTQYAGQTQTFDQTYDALPSICPTPTNIASAIPAIQIRRVS